MFSEIIRENQIRDLGVIFDTKLTFHNHIYSCVQTASRSLGFIIRSCFQFVDTASFKTLYFALVRSRLEYGSTVWSPHYLYVKLSLERVQRRFLKYLYKLTIGVFPARGFNQCELLVMYEIESLNYRRKIVDLKLLYQLLHNICDSSFMLGSLSFRIPSTGTRNMTVFCYPRCKTNLELKSPVYRLSAIGNTLSADCDLFQDILPKWLATFSLSPTSVV